MVVLWVGRVMDRRWDPIAYSQLEARKRARAVQVHRLDAQQDRSSIVGMRAIQLGNIRCQSTQLT